MAEKRITLSVQAVSEEQTWFQNNYFTGKDPNMVYVICKYITLWHVLNHEGPQKNKFQKNNCNVCLLKYQDSVQLVRVIDFGSHAVFFPSDL
jgi:hypothetical protein